MIQNISLDETKYILILYFTRLFKIVLFVDDMNFSTMKWIERLVIQFSINKKHTTNFDEPIKIIKLNYCFYMDAIYFHTCVRTIIFA